MAYRIRPFRDGDAEALSELFRVSIATIGPRAYSPEQVSAWMSRMPATDGFRERFAAGDTIIVAADEYDRAVAYAILETEGDGDGHLDHLYCHPDHSRRGLADALLNEAERQARSDGLPRLFAEASELARPAFERAGYRVTHRRDFEVAGVPIHNFAMEKVLAR